MVKQSELLARRQQVQLAVMMFVAGALLFLGAGFVWYEKVYSTPNSVFWGMVDSSLKSYGQTKHVSQDDTARSLSQVQDSRLQLGAQTAAQGRTVLTQNANTPEAVSITTESIGTPNTNYVRYADIDLGTATPAGKKPDFSKLENTWAKQEDVTPSTSSFIETLYGSLGHIPTANLKVHDRKTLITNMKNDKVYKIVSSNKEMKDGRLTQYLQIEVNAEKYVTMLKQLDKYNGLKQLQNVDVSQYAGKPAIAISIRVDILSRNLMEMTYNGTAQKETYSAFGAFVPVRVPQQSIPTEELEKQVQLILAGQ